MKLKNKKVLVTGAGGFIGSHLVEALLKEGCDVRAFVFYNPLNSWGWLENTDAEVVTGDIRDINNVKLAMEGADIVFHLAALIGIPYSYNSIDSYVDTNIKGSVNVLHAAQGVERILLTSTSEVYGTVYSSITEDYPLKAQSPYSASKIAMEAIGEAFRRSFDLPVTIVRPFNTYGPRQSARAIIPTIITQLLTGNKVKLGSLEPIRDFNYVEDVCEGFIKIAQGNTIGETINISTGEGTSIKDLAKMLVKKINPKAKIILDKQRVRPKHSEVDSLVGSSLKMAFLTDWIPTHNLDKGLDKTIKWFRKHMNLYKPGVYNI